ncbi:large ribosomal subunit protein eL28-like [Eurosta solidaginis]|uniref:large ribosomal subunit protein eL28-like n=1 Tax=Eurosta solidaginis TaxID=178769 RepID=UPI003530A0BC
MYFLNTSKFDYCADATTANFTSNMEFPVSFRHHYQEIKIQNDHHIADLNWLIIRNNNSFLLNKRDVKKSFSIEANNLANVSSFRYSGLVHKKAVGVVPAADKKGFTVVLKKGKYAQRPAKNTVHYSFKAGPRRSLKK